MIHYAEIRVFHNISVRSGNLILHSFVEVSICIFNIFRMDYFNDTSL